MRAAPAATRGVGDARVAIEQGMNDPRDLGALIAAATGAPFRISGREPVGGGSIHRAERIDNMRTGTPASVFAKRGAAEILPMFEAEADGLARLRGAARGVRIPGVLFRGLHGEEAVLILDWIDLAPIDALSGAALGEALALLHRATSDTFGLARDNFIGATAQVNTPDTDWVRFWQNQRLHFQLRLAARNRYPTRLIDRGERLAADCAAFFSTYRPAPSLLHGDLWGGNAGRDADGTPVIFDPAAYYGDREADVAMTTLFGGFPDEFFSAYANAWPLDSGYATRRQFYNLYHLLNHANLFAGDYVRQAERSIELLLAELG